MIKFLSKQKNSLLVNPMKYGVIAGGKKIRSTIILDTGKIYNIKEKTYKYFAQPLNVFILTH